MAAIPVTAPVAAVRYTDTEPVTGTAYGEENCVLQDGAYYINRYSDNPVDPAVLNTGGKDFYIVRVVGANGRHAYIGPLWVEAAPEKTAGEKQRLSPVALNCLLVRNR